MGRARNETANDSSFEDEFSVTNSAFDDFDTCDFDEADDELLAVAGRRSPSRSLPHDWADFDFGGGREDPFDSPWR